MEKLLTQFGTAADSAEGASKDILSMLGIDWQILIFQIIAFLVLVWFLGKFVYPVLMKTIDARQKDIEASVKAAADAEKNASKIKEEMAKLLADARLEASDVVSTAKLEAAAMIEKADAKSKERTERAVAEAQAQIDKNILAAKKALHNETLELVALATEKVIGKTVSGKVDEKVISAAIKEAR